MSNREILHLDLHDIPTVSKKMKYFDGDIYFADNITGTPSYYDGVIHVNFMILVFCISGNIRLTIDKQVMELNAHGTLFINAGSYIEINESSDDFACKLCAMKSELSFSLINKSLVDAIMQLKETPIVQLTPQEISLLLKYYELADFKMSHPQFANKETITAILKAFAIDLLTFINSHVPDNQNILRQGDKLYRRFLYLVTSNVDGHRSVKSYADELCVSPKYLTSVCRQHGKMAASEIITTRLVARIKHLLLYSDMSVKEIASQLNFDNLSFFGKFVKKHLGQSPVNFRKANNYGV